MAEEAQQALSSAQTRLTALEAAHWELQQQLAERDAQLQSALTRLTDTTRALSEATSCAAEQQGGAAAALAAAKQQRLAEVQGLQAALVERDQQVQATLTRLVDTTKQLQAVQGKLHKAELLVRAVEEREGGKREAAVRELQGQLGERDQQLQLMLARLVEVNHQLTAAGETAKQQQEEAAARLQELSTRHAEEAASLRQRNHDLQEQLRVALQQLEGARHGSASSSPRAGGMVGPTSQQVVASHHLLLERDKQLQQALSKLVDTSQQLNAAQQELAGAKAAAQAAQAQVVAAKDAALAAAQQQVAERDGQLREALQQVMAATRALQAARSEAAAAHQLAAQRGAGEEAARAALLATQQQLAERDQQVASLLEQLVGCDASRQGVGLIRSASLQQGLLAPAGMNALTPMPPQPAAKEPRPASVAASAVGMARPTLLRTGSLASSPCGPVGPLTGALMANYGNANTPAGSKQVEQQPAPGGAGDAAKRLIRSGSLQQLEPGLVRHHA
jgi:chromosome segregation ATPase